MGLSSWLCRRCSHPIACPYYLRPGTSWMNRVVLVQAQGIEIARGTYDGYQRIQTGEDDVVELEVMDEERWLGPEIYHEACFDVHGPTAKRGMTESDDSQGGFTAPLPSIKAPTKAKKRTKARAAP